MDRLHNHGKFWSNFAEFETIKKGSHNHLFFFFFFCIKPRGQIMHPAPSDSNGMRWITFSEDILLKIFTTFGNAGVYVDVYCFLLILTLQAKHRINGRTGESDVSLPNSCTFIMILIKYSSHTGLVTHGRFFVRGLCGVALLTKKKKTTITKTWV